MDQAAALEVGAGHDGLAVGDGVGHSAAPESGVEAVVGVAGEQADGDLGAFVIEASAHIGRAGKDIHQTAVLRRPRLPCQFGPVYPRVAVLDGSFPFRGDLYRRIAALLFHPVILFFPVSFSELPYLTQRNKSEDDKCLSFYFSHIVSCYFARPVL